METLLSKGNTSTSTECILVFNEPKDQWEPIFGTCVFLFSFLIPMAIISICYSLMVKRLRNVRILSGSKEKDRNLRRITRMVLVVVAAFVVCWTPIHILVLAQSLGFILRSMYAVVMFHFCIALGYINSGLNPVLYAFLDENFKRCFPVSVPPRHPAVRQNEEHRQGGGSGLQLQGRGRRGARRGDGESSMTRRGASFGGGRPHAEGRDSWDRELQHRANSDHGALAARALPPPNAQTGMGRGGGGRGRWCKAAQVWGRVLRVFNVNPNDPRRHEGVAGTHDFTLKKRPGYSEIPATNLICDNRVLITEHWLSSKQREEE
ncbi:hypothetical protein CCH79_00017076 [Gambusia affinis]|uniref:G-protein coupled receptors family 1 profile domain-containing protein n=1 Tax=Gambusia affinis TaxID=33528 RepID=A0A315W1K9_GAMAF|nr:hypothetical protein CCH79_00017076 [Gambusia affinis]